MIDNLHLCQNRLNVLTMNTKLNLTVVLHFNEKKVRVFVYRTSVT